MPTLPIPGSSPPCHLAYDLHRPDEPVDPRRCVLYCHGFASNRSGEKASYFRDRFLDAGLAFCRFDFRGHGESGGELRNLTLSRNLDDLRRMHDLLRSEGFERLVLFGSSMGGGSCTWYAAHNPEEIDAAIHIAPGLEMDRGLLRRVGPAKAEEWRRTGTVLFEHELGPKELDWELIEDLRTYDRQALGSLYRTPTLIFQGVADATVDWRSVADFVEACEGRAVHLHLVADGDHRLIDRLPLLWQLSLNFLVDRGWARG